MSAGAKCRAENYATCEEKAVCSGTQAECPTSLAMPDGIECIERGKCRGGKCIPYCETQGLQSCMCDTGEMSFVRKRALFGKYRKIAQISRSPI